MPEAKESYGNEVQSHQHRIDQAAPRKYRLGEFKGAEVFRSVEIRFFTTYRGPAHKMYMGCLVAAFVKVRADGIRHIFRVNAHESEWDEQS